MIKAICKYYLRFPPLARNAINISLRGAMSCVGVEYYAPVPEHILLDCDSVLNKKLFAC